jgi:Uma2 family endonuclease
MRTVKFIPRYTVSDYNRWEGAWELIDGVPCAMSPSPVFRHQNFQAILLRQMGNALDAKSSACGNCTVVSDLDWIVDDDTVLKPDIAIVCGQQGDFITTPPVLIVEILSPSTAMNDRHVKFEIYQEQGVKYYIIADPAAHTYHSYLLTGQQYQEKELNAIEIHDGCTIGIDLSKAMAGLKD